MRLDWLDDILAVAEAGSFDAAAARRHLTPSAFSRRIRQIEGHIGADLFDRSRKPVRLTPATADQRERIARLAAELRQLTEDLRQGGRQAAARVVLVSQHALTAARTPALIRALQARHGDIGFRLRSANLDDCYAELLARRADLALVYRLPDAAHPIEADYVETLPLGRDRLIPVIAARVAAKAGAAGIGGAEIGGGEIGGGEIGGAEIGGAGTELPVIAYPSDVFLGRIMERAVLPRLRAVLRPVPKVETALTLAALDLAAEGLGVAWVPAALARQRLADGSLADLSARLPGCDLAVDAVRLAGRAGPYAAAVWDALADDRPPDDPPR